MKFAKQVSAAPVAFGMMIAVLLFPLPGLAANDLSVIRGEVRDSSGLPVVGALVVAAGGTASLPERMVFTDNRGSFLIQNLLAGEYAVKVTMSRFLPFDRNGIQLAAGATAMLSVNLQYAWDVLRRAASRTDKEAQDIVWTLRSSRSTQPVLRLVEEENSETLPDANLLADYSGYFQVYSKSVETSSGTADGVGSRFSLTMPLQSNGKVTLAGHYSESPTEPRGFGATYDFKPADRHRSKIALNIRQGMLSGESFQGEQLKEIQVEYGEKFQWSDHLVLDYGADVGRADGRTTHNYFRPRLGVEWVPDVRTIFDVSATMQAPSREEHPIRGKEYFEQVYLPATLERYLHGEFGVSRLISDDTQVSVAVFRDQANHHALFVTAADGRRGILIVDSRNMPSQGLRFHFNREFENFETGIGYTAASAVGLSDPSATLDQVQDHFTRKRFHVVTARVKTDVDITNTELTAVYRWMSEFAASPIDPYQSYAEYNDPTLSITVAQNLPNWRSFPGQLQAILDARNLFEQQPFGPQKTQLAHSPRLVKGGINIRF
jgi:hypothetical protein